jgi:hypothetical protein
MLLGRMSACRFRRAVTIVDQGIGVGGSEALLEPTEKGVDVLNALAQSGSGPIAQIVWCGLIR